MAVNRVRELQAFAIRVGRVGTCTECAERVVEKFGGVVVGFFHADNPTAQVAEAEDGHDFAIVDSRYLVDPWQSSVYGDPAVYDLTEPSDVARVHVLYGDPSQWQFCHRESSGGSRTSLAIEVTIRGTSPVSSPSAALCRIDSSSLSIQTGVKHQRPRRDAEGAPKL